MEKLLEIMEILRSSKGCPWDQKQTHETLRKHVIEEAFEVADAINQGQSDQLCDELGDLLFQIVFHAQIAKENGYFDFQNIVDTCCEKMKRRHPHVFSESISENEILSWEQIKQKERGSDKGIMSGLPITMPAIMKAQKVLSKVENMGFPVSESSSSNMEYKCEDNGESVKCEEFLGQALLSYLSLYPEFDGEKSLNKVVDRIVAAFNDASIEDALFYEKLNYEEKIAFFERAKLGK